MAQGSLCLQALGSVHTFPSEGWSLGILVPHFTDVKTEIALHEGTTEWREGTWPIQQGRKPRGVSARTSSLVLRALSSFRLCLGAAPDSVSEATRGSRERMWVYNMRRRNKVLGPVSPACEMLLGHALPLSLLQEYWHDPRRCPYPHLCALPGDFNPRTIAVTTSLEHPHSQLPQMPSC